MVIWSQWSYLGSRRGPASVSSNAARDIATEAYQHCQHGRHSLGRCVLPGVVDRAGGRAEIGYRAERPWKWSS